MDDMPVLDVAIGLIFMYLLLSMLVTVVQEGIASALKLRSKNLFEAIDNLLNDPQLTKKYGRLVFDFYQHPLIRSLYRIGEKPAPGPTTRGSRGDPKAFLKQYRLGLPSYIPSRTFAIALLDVLRDKSKLSTATGADELLAKADEVVDSLPESELKRTLVLLIGDAGKRASALDEKAQHVALRVESWFNDSMVRAAGWYKRTAQRWSIGVGMAVAIFANADSFHVANQLWNDSNLRARVTAAAEAYHQEQDGAPDGAAAGDGSIRQRFAAQMGQLEASALPIGWSDSGWARLEALKVDLAADPQQGFRGLLGWVLGLLATGFAASLGATFWFDLLGRILQLRSSGGRISAATGALEVRGKKAASETVPPPSAGGGQS